MSIIQLGKDNGWSVYDLNGYRQYVQKVTLTGTTQSVELLLPISFRLNKISQFFNTTNARTFNIRLFPTNEDTSAYEQLDIDTANVAQSRIFIPDDVNVYAYLTAGKLQFNYSSYTATDTITIIVNTKLIAGC